LPNKLDLKRILFGSQPMPQAYLKEIYFEKDLKRLRETSYSIRFQKDLLALLSKLGHLNFINRQGKNQEMV
jgi:hypothetical protein